MKVLLISPKTKESKGGIAVWTEHYLQGLSASGNNCDVVNTATVGKRSVNLNAKRSIKDEWIRTRRILKDLKETLKGNTYDVAHLNSSIGVFGIIRDYYFAKRIVKKKIPLAVHFHCDVPFWVNNGVIKYYLKKLLKISNTAFVLCENSRKYLKDTFDYDAVKVPNFMDDALIIEKKKISEKLEKIFFVGRVSRLKGAKEIYELARRFPDVRFELIGEVTADVAEWDKPENIDLLGMMPHDEVLAHLDTSDVFLFPSYTEGFSMALAESMARGVPAIATDVGANADMLENKGGVVVSVGDVEAMQKAMDELSAQDTRAEMSRWCIAKVRENYATQKVMELFCGAYEKMKQ